MAYDETKDGTRYDQLTSSSLHNFIFLIFLRRLLPSLVRLHSFPSFRISFLFLLRLNSCIVSVSPVLGCFMRSLNERAHSTSTLLYLCIHLNRYITEYHYYITIIIYNEKMLLLMCALAVRTRRQSMQCRCRPRQPGIDAQSERAQWRNTRTKKKKNENTSTS